LTLAADHELDTYVGVAPCAFPEQAMNEAYGENHEDDADAYTDNADSGSTGMVCEVGSDETIHRHR